MTNGIFRRGMSEVPKASPPEDQSRPGKFTAFCAYEWTSNPDYRNMHRNVFFKE